MNGLGTRKIRKLVTEDVHDKFVEMVLDFARENKMTASNIVDGVDSAVSHMMNNAMLEMETSKILPISTQSTQINKSDTDTDLPPEQSSTNGLSQ